MDQEIDKSDDHRLRDPIRVRCPRGYDGIGNALRSAYRDHDDTRNGLAEMLRKLDRVD